MIKRALIVGCLLLTPFAACAQTGPVNGYCTQGGTKAAVSGLGSTNFLQGIVPKCTVTVYIDGYQSVTGATYQSGGTVTGSATQTCNATFTGGVSSATGTIALTGTNSIAASTAFVISTGGQYATNPTTATLTSGTATCSGTVAITPTMGPTPATIYADKSSTPLTNPFTASAINGQYLFYASYINCYDVVLSGGIPPNTYATPSTLTGICLAVAGSSGMVNPGQLALAQYPTTSASSVSPANFTYDAATGNNLTVPSNVFLASSVSSAQPILDIRHPSFGGNASICDGTNTQDIGPALQSAWNALPVTGGQILIPGSPLNCYWANPTTFNWGSKTAPVTLIIQGQLRTGTTLFLPFGTKLVLKGQSANGNAQFTPLGETGSIFARPASNVPITGTLNTAVTPTYTGAESPTGSTPVTCNSAANGATYQDTSGIKAVMWTCADTTGTMSLSTPTIMNVASVGGFIVGDSVLVAGAGVSGGNLSAFITGISGTTFTLGTAASTAVSGAAVTNTVTGTTSNWRPGAVATITPSSMAGITVNTGLNIAEQETCTLNTISRNSVNVATGTFSSSCHIPAGVPITVAGVSDSSYNGTHANGSVTGPFLVQTSNYGTNTQTWGNTGSAGSSSGGTVTGFNEDAAEAILVNQITSSTFTALFYRPHISTAQFGLVTFWENALASGPTIRDISFISDGLGVKMQGYRAVTERVSTGGQGACSGNLTSMGIDIIDSNYSVFDSFTSTAFCQPWSVHLYRPWNNTISDNGALTFTNSVFVGSGIKLDHGSHGIEIKHNSFCEQCPRGFISFDDSVSYWSGSPQFLSIDHSWTQDNQQGYTTCYVNALAPSVGGVPTIKLEQNSGFAACNTNEYVLNGVKTDSNLSYGVSSFSGPVGTFDDGRTREGELRGIQAGMSPTVIPFATANVTTNPANWSGSCTIATGVLAPDGTTTAGSLSGFNTNIFNVGSTTITPATGDMVLFGGWVYTPALNKAAYVVGTGQAFVVDNNTSTHFSFSNSTQLAGNYSAVGTTPYDSQLFNDWWHPLVGFAIVGASDGTAGQSIRLNLGCSTDRTLSYWQPFMIYIPASAGFSQTEVMRWRTQLLHGAVPANWNHAGVAATTLPIATPSILPEIIYSAAGTALPSCTAALNGTTATVSDATSPTYRASYTSGGTVTTLVQCDGGSTTWLTH